LPDDVASGGAERIKALTDRVWFKVKVINLRGAATELLPEDSAEPELLNTAQAWWWLGAAGERKQDSRSDFYKAVESEATRAGSGSGTVSTEFLLPQDIDYKRLRGEAAHEVNESLKLVVRKLIYTSLTTGHTATAEITGHLLKARVQAADGEAYLAIATEGFTHPKIIAVILASVPGVPTDHWQAEPSAKLGIEPGLGQIVYSAIIPPEAQTQIIELFADESTDESH
jgi:hypothetical protein